MNAWNIVTKKGKKATDAKPVAEKATEAITEKATEAITEKATEAITEKATDTNPISKDWLNAVVRNKHAFLTNTSTESPAKATHTSRPAHPFMWSVHSRLTVGGSTWVATDPRQEGIMYMFVKGAWVHKTDDKIIMVSKQLKTGSKKERVWKSETKSLRSPTKQDFCLSKQDFPGL
jgi:hypothetical protein